MGLQRSLLVFAHAAEAQAFHDVPHVVTGVGKVNAAVELAQKLARGGIKRVVVLGTAGVVGDGANRLSLNRVYQVTRLLQHDFSLPTPPLAAAGEKLLPASECVTMATGDQFVTSDDKRAQLSDLGAQLVDMEGYAYARVCASYGVELQIFKVPSDFADSSTTDAEWDDVVAVKSRQLREFWDARFASKHPYLRGAAVPRVLAHRGFVSSAMVAQTIAENTRAAIAAAVSLGAEFIESDCRVSAEGTPVLFHDANLQRLFGDPREVRQVPLNELRELCAARGGLLTVAEALAEFPAARFNFDVKDEAAALAVGHAVGEDLHRVLLTSFSGANRRRAVRVAQAVARDCSAAQTTVAIAPGRAEVIALLIAVWLRCPALERWAMRGFSALQLPLKQGFIRVVTPRLLRAARRNGVEVHVWTVNDPLVMRHLLTLGVDGLVTDRADLALPLCRAEF